MSDSKNENSTAPQHDRRTRRESIMGSTLNLNEKAVLLALEHHLGESGLVYPSISLLARHLSLNGRQVRRLLAQLRPENQQDREAHKRALGAYNRAVEEAERKGEDEGKPRKPILIRRGVLTWKRRGQTSNQYEILWAVLSELQHKADRTRATGQREYSDRTRATGLNVPTGHVQPSDRTPVSFQTGRAVPPNSSENKQNCFRSERQSSLEENLPDLNGADKASVFDELDEDALRDTQRLSDWLKGQADSRHPVIAKPKTSDFRNVVAAAEQALAKGHDPIKLFRSIVGKKRFDSIPKAVRDRANLRVDQFVAEQKARVQ